MPTTDVPTDLALPLLLTPLAAAEALSVSPRTLWGLTHPRGPIRPVRIGRSVRYARAELQRWIDTQQEEGCRD
jgi:predicted DNA-binding transcriptional regulator AlpA